MTKIKKQDFVEIEYTGKLKDEGYVFDTTDEKIAKENGLFNEKHTYGPVKIMVGNAQVLPGLDKFIEGKEPGTFKVELKPEQGFGKKNAKLLKLLPKSIFTKQEINPMPGLPVSIDDMEGMIKTVSGGRCIVDFNHPLSGKELQYDLKINRIVTDEKEKVEAMIELQLDKKDFEVKLEGENVTITLNTEVKKPLKDLLADMIKKFTKLKQVEFKDNKK
ncbi:peptidylprolyl isomerase [Candidatus Woesearchaeota archaeon B3_Woes]|nr:MAG: peptidylprolyl isomerase [Candidatus Woesearchaeota archaeon B3_Woes]